MVEGSRKKKVLFVCVGNMCRSQMAEGFARHIAGDFVEAYSAGTNHSGEVSKQAVAVMGELGIDISRQHSKGLEDVPLDQMDYVVTMGCCSANQLCPVTYDGEKIDWPIEDPVGRPTDVFRRVRDDIERRVRQLLETIWKAKDISTKG